MFRTFYLMTGCIMTGLVPALAQAADIERVEGYLKLIEERAELTLCREPFYPPGECNRARFTQGLRYNWIHSIDARSNEQISLIHDTERNGSRPVFHSTIPGYRGMHVDRIPEDTWCMPELGRHEGERFHARIASFSESGRNPSGRRLAQYGLYIVATSERDCNTLLDHGRTMLTNGG